jgi:hypothetical protein
MTKNSLFSISCQSCNAYFGADSPTPLSRSNPPRAHDYQRSATSSSQSNDMHTSVESTHSEPHFSRPLSPRQPPPSPVQHQSSQNHLPRSPSSGSSCSLVFVPASPTTSMSPTNIDAAMPSSQSLYSTPINYARPPTIPFVPLSSSALNSRYANNYTVLNQLTTINPIAPGGNLNPPSPNGDRSPSTDVAMARHVQSSSSSFY